MKTILKIEGMSCKHCVAHVEKALQGIEGLSKIKVDLAKNQAEFTSSNFDENQVRSAISEAGYQVVSFANS